MPIIWFRNLEIIECQEMNKISDEVINFLTKAMGI